jgi:hypothetical protein
LRAQASCDRQIPSHPGIGVKSLQAVEKGAPASLRSDPLATTYQLNTSSLVDFSRASHLDLFEQPGIRVFQQPVYF